MVHCFPQVIPRRFSQEKLALPSLQLLLMLLLLSFVTFVMHGCIGKGMSITNKAQFTAGTGNCDPDHRATQGNHPTPK